jgi:DNA-directed RNA polymerase subunit RPC12/RpoP
MNVTTFVLICVTIIVIRSTIKKFAAYKEKEAEQQARSQAMVLHRPAPAEMPETPPVNVLQRHRSVPMNTKLSVRIRCPICNTRLLTSGEARGRRVICPECDHRLIVPTRRLPVVVYRPGPMEQPELPYMPPMTLSPVEPTVPLSLKFPQGTGGIQTTVTQKTADDLTKVATGGFLVAIGMVLLAIITGGRFKPGA